MHAYTIRLRALGSYFGNFINPVLLLILVLTDNKSNSYYIIWLCLTRTGNDQIHEFDWLKWILTAV